MRAPASFVCLDTAEGPSPQSAARPTTGSSRMRSKSRGRLVLPLRLAIEHEDLEGAVRVEHDLAVVAPHLPPRQLPDRPGRLLAHDLLEAKPVAAHHVGLARVEQCELVLCEPALEH